jgi:hypothetical protein
MNGFSRLCERYGNQGAGGSCLECCQSEVCVGCAEGNCGSRSVAVVESADPRSCIDEKGRNRKPFFFEGRGRKTGKDSPRSFREISHSGRSRRWQRQCPYIVKDMKEASIRCQFFPRTHLLSSRITRSQSHAPGSFYLSASLLQIQMSSGSACGAPPVSIIHIPTRISQVCRREDMEPWR